MGETAKKSAFNVSKEAIGKAGQCTKGLSCLHGERDDLCPVEYCVAGEVHFIECRFEGNCPYQSSFGDGQLCQCPVRKELYNQHGI